MIYSCIYFFLLSLLIHYPFVHILKYDKNTAWYFIHVVCNSLVVYLTYNDLGICLTDFDKAVDSKLFDSSALGLTLGLHLYHIFICFEKLTIIDWLHHIINNILMVYVGMYYISLPAWNCGIFFMCGLPGGIDYFLLFLNKLGKISRIKEKYYNVYLNNWIRAPGIFYCSSILYIAYTQNILQVPMYVIAPTLFSIVFNAVYFAERVTLNYAISSK